MAEIFPYLKEEVILNPLKFVRNEVYLHWRPKDLLRLICWRFWHYLKSSHSVEEPSKRINWDSYQDVLTKCWEPFFGQQVTNGNGLAEKTFPYILCHTQMRPRQLILLCNSIAEQAEARGAFPQFSSTDLIKGIKKGEERLADEIFNSYNEVYPGAARIAEALSGLPLLFKGNLLDRRAPHSASQWPKGLYSQHAFRQFVAELGIVGRVRQVNKQAGYIEADFEYAKEGRLPLLVDDDCVIHPMFYKKLNIQIDQKLRVYPFPDHEEFKELNYLP